MNHLNHQLKTQLNSPPATSTGQPTTQEDAGDLDLGGRGSRQGATAQHPTGAHRGGQRTHRSHQVPAARALAVQ